MLSEKNNLGHSTKTTILRFLISLISLMEMEMLKHNKIHRSKKPTTQKLGDDDEERRSEF